MTKYIKTYEAYKDGWYFYTHKEINTILNGIAKAWKKKTEIKVDKNINIFEIYLLLNSYSYKNGNVYKIIPGNYEWWAVLTINNTFAITPNIHYTTERRFTDGKVMGRWDDEDYGDLHLTDHFPTPKEIIQIFSDRKNFIFGERHTRGRAIPKGATNTLIEIRKKSKNNIDFEKYWNERIKNFPEWYKRLKRKNLITHSMEKEWKHLGTEFGLFDD